MRRESPVERAYERALDVLCRELVARLGEIGAEVAKGVEYGGIAARVVAAFEAQPHNTERQRRLLADAFQRLDERPTWYGNGNHCQGWHSVLRIARNSSRVHDLFTLWS